MVERLKPRKWHDQVEKPPEKMPPSKRMSQEEGRARYVKNRDAIRGDTAVKDDWGPRTEVFKVGNVTIYYRSKASGVSKEQRRYYAGQLQIAFVRIFGDHCTLHTTPGLLVSDTVHRDLKELYKTLEELLRS